MNDQKKQYNGMNLRRSRSVRDVSPLRLRRLTDEEYEALQQKHIAKTKGKQEEERDVKH